MGVGIGDYNLDGHLDLFLVTGNIHPEIEAKVPGYPYKTPRVVFRNLGNGKFEELIEAAGSAIAAPTPAAVALSATSTTMATSIF